MVFLNQLDRAHAIEAGRQGLIPCLVKSKPWKTALVPASFWRQWMGARERFSCGAATGLTQHQCSI